MSLRADTAGRRLVAALGVLLLLAPARTPITAQGRGGAPPASRSSAAPAALPQGTADVFRRYADRVMKVQIVERGSAAKATIGSAFFITPDGHAVTNYHVVSQVVHAPERYRAELVNAAGARHEVTLLGVDVVNDLAVLGSPLRPAGWFDLADHAVDQGTRLYSLGYPNDIGLTIVEGTYNGPVRHVLYPRLHLTAAINTGMSGGPTLTEDGRVVGVNVSIADESNEIAFLVPVERAVALARRVLAPGGAVPPARALADVGRQLRTHQAAYLRGMFEGKTETVALGPFRVVTQPAPFFRCWADADRGEDRTVETVYHQCSTDDHVFVAGGQSSGTVRLTHQLLTSRVLNPARFYARYAQQFGQDGTPSGDEEHVTSWQCGTRNVANDALRMRAVLCLRRYRKLGALYDGMLRVATLGRGNAGLVSTLVMTGVTAESADRLTRRYLEHVTWR